MRAGLLHFGSFVLAVSSFAACGARSSLNVPPPSQNGGAGGTASVGGSGGASTSTTSSTGGQGGTPVACVDGETVECGTDIGACQKGLRTCQDEVFGPCVGSVEPVTEQCNGIDDDCDGQVDEGFNLGAPCDDIDNDLCLDSVITCDGCSKSPDKLEVCNGIDDDCDGVVDADCDVGDCQPALEVTGSTPSSPGCVDFPVTKGSTGVIVYPCTGGPVTATLGDVTFTGSVQGGFVSLSGVSMFPDPAGCLWQATHQIQGNIASGQLSYSYVEMVLTPGPQCWSPCTEVGTVAITWAVAP